MLIFLMSKFLPPPSVTGTLSITTGDIDLSKEHRKTPISGEHIAEMIKTLTVNIKTKPIVRPVVADWTAQEIELLKVRWDRQGTNIPELRYPEHPALKGFFTGKFSADEIGRKAVSFRLNSKSN